jgi:hypothetical protein
MTNRKTTCRLMLQLAPRAHTDAELRSQVREAFNRAGFTDIEWIGLAGDATTLDDRSDVARPQLIVRVSHEPNAVGSPALQLRLAFALRDVRLWLPDLPLGLQVISGSGLRRLSFAPTDSPDDIQAGVLALEDALRLDLSVVGWHSAERRWAGL